MTSPESTDGFQPPSHGLRATLERVAAAFDSHALGPGEVAQLRRLDTGAPDQPAFWKLLALAIAGEQPLPPGSEGRWAAALAGLALLGPESHARHRRPGQVLAGAGFSEMRFQRLLRSQGPALADAFRRACAFLARKAETVDWADLARLVLETDPARRESTRREMARHYYHALHHAEQED